MAKREGSSSSGPRTRGKARREAKKELDAREVENARRLDKLPPEVWEKVLVDLDWMDFFPLAMSCRYFREKQNELGARKRKYGPDSLRAFIPVFSDLETKFKEGPPASVDYLRFLKEQETLGNSAERGSSERFERFRGGDFILSLAAFHGYLPLLQEADPGKLMDGDSFLGRPSKRLSGRIINAAARGGQLEILQWLKTQKGFKLGASLFASACKSGNLEVLKWLRSEGCPWNGSACKACSNAASGGHLELLKWLRSEGCPWNKEACKGAARGGHLEVLKWLRTEGCPWSESACADAAGGGHLEVLKWLRSEGCPWSASTCADAAQNGHLEVLEWLRSEGCPWDESSYHRIPPRSWVCYRAALYGHLEVLEWLRSEGCPWDEITCCGAAEGNQLELLKLLRSEGCPWDSCACTYAANYGRMEMLKWLRSEGCPWDVGTWHEAAMWGRINVLEYLHENGCPFHPDIKAMAARVSIKWFEENGYGGDEYSDDEDE